MNDEVRAAQEETMRSLAADYQTVFGDAAGKRVLQDIFNRVLMTNQKLITRPPEWAPYLAALHDAATDICAMLNFSFEQRKPKLTERPRFTSRAHT